MKYKGLIRAPVVAVYPLAPRRGEVVYHTTDGHMYFNGSNWVPL